MATTTRRRRWTPPEDLRSMAREHVRCRTYGHAWDDFIPMMKPARFGDRISLRCVRCTTERHDIVSWVDGSLLSRKYEHPEDYAMAEHHTRAEYRATLLHLRKEEARQGSGNGDGQGSGNGRGQGGHLREVDLREANEGEQKRGRRERSRARVASGR